jgi:isocitrate lyase
MSAENISYDLKRFAGIKRDYKENEVERLRGIFKNRIFYMQAAITKTMEFIEF